MLKKFKDAINDYISKEQWYFLCATVVFVLLAVLFMGKVADIRLKELEYSLRDMNPERSASASLSLISRYQRLQKRLSGVTDTKKDFLAESESLAVAAGGLLANSDKPKETIIDNISIAIVNMFSYLTGGKPVRNFKDERGEDILRVAFLYERKRDYDAAVKAYTSAIYYFKNNRKRLSYIFLHRGYCKALKNNKKPAIKDLNISYKFDRKGDTGRTAAALVLFISNLQHKLHLVLKMNNTTKKGELLYRLMSYDQAINTLTKADKKETNQKSLFYRGRAHEELGNTSEAIKDYRKIIAINKYQKWAIKANRRLYLLGAFYSSNKKLTEESKHTAKITHDTKAFEQTKVFQETTQIEKIDSIEKDDKTKETLEAIEEIKIESEIEVKEEPLNKINTLSVLPIATSKSEHDLAKIEADITRIRKESERKLAIKIIRKKTTPRRRRKKLLIEKFDFIDRIRLRDGSTYYGIIDKKTKSMLTLLTVRGKRNLPTDLIIKKKKVRPKPSFFNISDKSANKVVLSEVLSPKDLKKLFNLSSTRQNRRNILRSQFKQLDNLILRDGNQFYGIIYSKNNYEIRLITILGVIKVPLSRVVTIEKINSKIAFP